jgi:hypothetical protein
MAIDRAMGRTNAEIAELHGYNAQHVGLIFQMPLMRELVRKYQEEVAQKAIDKVIDLAVWFDATAPSAAAKIKELMDTSEMDTVKLAAAKEILDRSPNAPKAKKFIDIETRGVVLQIPVATFENMRAAAKAVGEPLDIDYTEAEEIEESFDDAFDDS